MVEGGWSCTANLLCSGTGNSVASVKIDKPVQVILSDVGLLAAMYADGLQIRILNKEVDINFGSIYENAVAQELYAHGFELYYFNSKKQGELDFCDRI